MSFQGLSFCSRISFSLSPAEFLAAVWVYRKEINPVFDRCKGVKAAIPADIKEYYFRIRHAILEGSLYQCDMSAAEISFFREQSQDLFRIFIESCDRVRKPDAELHQNARSLIAELLVECDNAKLIGLDSVLKEGKITFTLTPCQDVILRRPY